MSIGTYLMIRKLRKAEKKLVEYSKKTRRDDEKEKERLTKAIMSLSEMIIVYEDDEGKIPMTEQTLKEKTIDELIERLKEMIKEAERNL